MTIIHEEIFHEIFIIDEIFEISPKYEKRLLLAANFKILLNIGTVRFLVAVGRGSGCRCGLAKIS